MRGQPASALHPICPAPRFLLSSPKIIDQGILRDDYRVIFASFIVMLVALLVVWILSTIRVGPRLSANTVFRVRITIVFVFITICILIIRSSITTPIDPQLFQTDDCMVSCWNNLIIGETSIDAVRSLESTYDFFRESEDEQFLARADWKGFVIRTTGGMRVQIDLLSGLVSQIELTATTSAFSLSLRDIINRLGNTDYVLLYYYEPSPPRIQVNISDIIFFYPEAGYIISAAFPSRLSEGVVKTCITGNELINNILIVKANTIDQVLVDIARQSDEISIPIFEDRWHNFILNGLRPLLTFGCFQMPYPPHISLGVESW